MCGSGGAGGFDPGQGEQGHSGGGGGGRHGNLDHLVSLDQTNHSLETLQGGLGVPLSTNQTLPRVHHLREGLAELLVLLLQVSTLLLQLYIPPEQTPLLPLSHRLVCNIGLDEVLWPRHIPFV